MWQGGYMDPFTPRLLATLDSVVPDSPAGLAGLEKGDQLKTIDGAPVQFWDEFTDLVKNNQDRTPMEITIDRNGMEQSFTIAPDDSQKLGVYPEVKMDEMLKVNHRSYTFAESVVPGFSRAYWTLNDYMSQFKYVFTKKGASSLGGFITIGSIFPSKWDWEAFWSITALLSIMLAFMNLLPIPALDGGHVVFTLYEIISGRKPSDKFLEYAQIAGFVILVSLLLFANGNDIYKWLTGQL
jgi:regulator of sigma E protease